MAGFQTAAVGNLILQRERPPTPVVDISLVRAKPAVVAPVQPVGKRVSVVVTTPMRKAMRERRAGGESLSSIAKFFGVSEPTVRRHTKDIPPPEGGWDRGGNKSKVPKEAIERLRRAGFTYDEIAENFGIGVSAIWRRVNHEARRSKLSRKRPPVHRALEQVCRATGVKASDLRRPRENHVGRSAVDISKGRHILFWMLVRRRGFSFPAAGNSMGGFDHSSVFNGVANVDRAIVALNLDHGAEMMPLIRALWAAEWPKACFERKAA